MVSVQREARDAGSEEMVEEMVNDGAPQERQERLRGGERRGTEPRAEARREDERGAPSERGAQALDPTGRGGPSGGRGNVMSCESQGSFSRASAQSFA